MYVCMYVYTYTHRKRRSRFSNAPRTTNGWRGLPRPSHPPPPPPRACGAHYSVSTELFLSLFRSQICEQGILKSLIKFISNYMIFYEIH
jgi:hypothetical protein